MKDKEFEFDEEDVEVAEQEVGILEVSFAIREWGEILYSLSATNLSISEIRDAMSLDMKDKFANLIGIISKTYDNNKKQIVKMNNGKAICFKLERALREISAHINK